MNDARRASPRPRARGPVRLAVPARNKLAVVGHPRRRARYFFLALLAIMSIFVGQLFRVQWFDAAKVQREALNSRLATTDLPAPRGDIVDSNGTVVARSIERMNVTGDPVAASAYLGSTKPNFPQGIPGVAAALTSVLGGDADEITKAFATASKRHSRFVYLAKDISPSQWGQIRALGLPGIGSEEYQRREYPQGTAMAPLIGWVNAAGVPGGGLEQMLNKDLKGTDGLHRRELAQNGSEIATGDNLDQEPVAGRDVQLTINNDLQWYAQNQLAQRVTEAKGKSGSIVISDRSGHILAAASYPSFDNNDLSTATATSLQDHAFTDTFEPGSTQKALTIGAVVDQGLMKPTDHVEVPSTLQRAGRPFKDAETHGTEFLTLAGVIARSSNMGTILAGERLPKQTLYDYMMKFGLGQPTGIGFPGESVGIVPKVDTWTGDRWYTLMFGQGLATTPMQQIGIFQTIANGGMRTPLTLVKGVQNADGTMVAASDTRASQRVFKETTAKQLIGMMEGVVSKDGSAPKAAVPGYDVAGKTATAQYYDSAHHRYDGVTAGFIGMAPAADPQIIVSVSIQQPSQGTFGGDVAAPAFAKVMSYALEQQKIPPNKAGKLPFPITYTNNKESSTK